MPSRILTCRNFARRLKSTVVLYCVLKDNKAEDGLTDIMVRAEDASKINRIFERFSLATVDMASVKTEIQRDRNALAKTAEEMESPERTSQTRDPADAFAEGVVKPEPASPTTEKPHNENPTTARTMKSRQSEPSSAPRREPGGGVSERSATRVRSSVRQELNDIRAEQRQKPGETGRERNSHRETRHKPVPKKKRSGKENR